MAPRVLVVEDEPENRLLLQVVLTTEGYEVEEADDGPSALAAAARLPDIVLLDVMMPGMNGYAVFERLRADPRTRGIPVVILTALAQRGDVERAVELGVDGFVTKPFEPADLLHTVESALRCRPGP